MELPVGDWPGSSHGRIPTRTQARLSPFAALAEFRVTTGARIIRGRNGDARGRSAQSSPGRPPGRSRPTCCERRPCRFGACTSRRRDRRCGRTPYSSDISLILSMPVLAAARTDGLPSLRSRARGSEARGSPISPSAPAAASRRCAPCPPEPQAGPAPASPRGTQG